MVMSKFCLFLLLADYSPFLTYPLKKDDNCLCTEVLLSMLELWKKLIGDGKLSRKFKTKRFNLVFVIEIIAVSPFHVGIYIA